MDLTGTPNDQDVSDKKPLTTSAPHQYVGGSIPVKYPGGATPAQNPGGAIPVKYPGEATPGQQTDGNTPGQYLGGATPGQNPGSATSVQYAGGATPGQNPGGTTPSQNPGGAAAVQYAGGATPGQIPGGATPCQRAPVPVQGQYPASAAQVQYPEGAGGGYYRLGDQPGQPVVNQPGIQTQIALMPQPSAQIPGCPPGLEYLLQLDQLLVHQQIELAEVLTNIEFENKYVIKNTLGQQVYFAREESEYCMRICCGAARGFVIHITDNMGQEVIRVNREFKCFAGCCWCAQAGNHCSYFIEVESPPGTVIGRVRQTTSALAPHFDIENESNECCLKIRGHWIHCQNVCCQEDIDFKIFTNDLQFLVGKVSKQYGGYLRERFTKADNFGVQFRDDLDVKMKAILLASTFLIDFMYFEQPKNNNKY